MKNLKQRVLEISYKKNLSHIGSCLTAVDIIEEIFEQKTDKDKFVLSAGHAGLALYVVLEEYEDNTNAEHLFDKCGVHPDRLKSDLIDCSTGSLGHGLPIATGMALGNPDIDVYCLISDGEIFEGSIYETFNFITRYNSPENLKIYLNLNESTAYENLSPLEIMKIKLFCKMQSININVRETKLNIPELEGVKGHYKKLTKQEFNKILINTNETT